MFYKVIYNGRVIDAIEKLIYVRYNEEINKMVLTSEAYAQGIVSSDGEYIWHVEGMNLIPLEGYDTVEVVAIDKYEYNQLKAFDLATPQEIIDNLVLEMINSNLL